MGAIQEHGTVDKANERWVLALGFALKERYTLIELVHPDSRSNPSGGHCCCSRPAAAAAGAGVWPRSGNG